MMSEKAAVCTVPFEECWYWWTGTSRNVSQVFWRAVWPGVHFHAAVGRVPDDSSPASDAEYRRHLCPRCNRPHRSAQLCCSVSHYLAKRRRHFVCCYLRCRTLPQVDIWRRTSPYVHVRACRMRRRMAPYAVWTWLKDHQWQWHIYSNDRPWDSNCRSTSFAQRTACWPPRVMQCDDC